MLIDDENLFETEARAGRGEQNIDRNCFSASVFYYFPHSRQNLFRPGEQSDPPLSSANFCLENYFPMIFAGIPNEVILLLRL